MSDNDWLKELKVGDPVYIYTSGTIGDSYRLTTVKKITPKGAIRVENGDLYKNGTYSVSGSWTWYYLKQWSPELQKELYDKKILSTKRYKIRETDWYKVSSENINKIHDLLHPTEAK